MSLKDFQIITKLGQGAYSSVYKVRRLADGIQYALKKVKLAQLTQKQKYNALNQVRLLASIHHPNVIRYKQAFIDEPLNALIIIMEYATNGDLYQKITEHSKKKTNFKEQQIWKIFIQIVMGLKALHDLKILHRDLKSANVFLTKSGTAKLGDLNVSKVSKGLCSTQTGTPYYASPEVWKDQPYDKKSDIWSLGCVLYQMTTLKPPFRSQDMEGLYKKVIRGYYPKIPNIYSSDISTLIKQLLDINPYFRPSCGIQNQLKLDKVLQLPNLIKHLGEIQLQQKDIGSQNILLKTIKISKSVKGLTQSLPKSNYYDQNNDRMQPLRRKLSKKKHIFLPSINNQQNKLNRYSEQFLYERKNSLQNLNKYNNNKQKPNLLIKRSQPNLMIGDDNKNFLIELYKERKRIQSMIQKYK